MVEAEPFPHIVREHVLSAGELDAVRRNWPARAHREEEPGGLGRTWCNLVIENRPAATPVLDLNGGFWRSFIAARLRPIYESVRLEFAPFIESRFGLLPEIRLQQLTLMQSEPGFVLHPAHNHYRFAPERVFTVLIHVGDGGDTRRGSRLYRHPAMNDVIEGPLVRQAEYALEKLPSCTPARDIPFARAG